MTMYETEWKEYSEGRDRYRIRARYGMDYEFARRHGQAPYFSLTGETERKAGRRWVEDSGGQMHGAIAAHFPELAPLAQWHLVSLDGPLHYFADAKYWWDMLQGRVERGNYDPDPADAFANTVVLGAVAGDRMPRFEQDWSEVRVWLEDRLPELMGNFVAEMERIDALE